MGVNHLAEASLSFLGYGVPPESSPGEACSVLKERVYAAGTSFGTWPGFVLSIVVYGINMFGDALRDLLDPRLRGRGRAVYPSIRKN